MALTDSEKELLESFYIEGPQAFYRAGYTTDDIVLFMSRQDVRAEMAAFFQEMQDGAAFDAIRRFVVRRRMARLANAAVSILGAALAGPRYQFNPDGTVARDNRGRLVLTRPEPTYTQIQAAREVLDRLGIVDPDARNEAVRQNVDPQKLASAYGGSTNVVEEITYPAELDTPEARAASRERMRKAISKLIEGVKEGNKRLRAELSAPARRKRNAKQKARRGNTESSKKKASKKRPKNSG